MLSKQPLFWVSVEEKTLLIILEDLFFCSIFPETLYI